MRLQFEKLKEKWIVENIEVIHPASAKEIKKFQEENEVVLPDDLMDYFNLLNGTGGETTDELYEFYSLSRLKTVREEFKDWEGIPDYKALFNSNEVNELFVFANFSFNLFAYAIRLSKGIPKGEIYVLCGGENKKIADSFSEFLDMYLENSIELQLNR